MRLLIIRRSPPVKQLWAQFVGETIRWSSPASFAKMLKRLYEEQQLNCGQMDTGGLNMAQVLQLDELKSKDCFVL